jgi:hypothetical protein
MTANNLASFEGAQLLTWIVNEISLLTARARPDNYTKIKVNTL